MDVRRSRDAAILRLAIGLAQGIALFLLQKADESKTWPATQPMLYAPVLVCVLMIPLLPLAALSAMRRTNLLIWTAVATVVTAILAVHAAWVGAAPDRIGASPLSPPLFLATAAMLFIAHHLVQPADAAGKPVAPYEAYFDLTWTNGVRLALSLAFTGAFWLLLFLAAALFKLIGIEAIGKLIGETAFAFPATGLMFAAAVHMAVQLTEARAGLVRGALTVGLTLLGWLLPLMVLIGGGFLATLPFTGLAPLWGTKAATALLLSAAAALILLINAAYQDGEEPPHLIPRLAARIAGLLLIPIVILAGYALWLRIDQYGLTPERVIAGVFLLVAIGFTIGYALAAVKPGPWMKPLERTNPIMAAVCVLLLIALFTPLADPARLSVASQVKRLAVGKVMADKFDYAFLRFDAGRYGREALEGLKASANPEIAKRAGEALAPDYNRPSRAPEAPKKLDLSKIKAYPTGARLPDDFVSQTWGEDTGSICLMSGSECPALVMDVDSDGTADVLLGAGGEFDVFQKRDGQWRKTAVADTACESPNIDEALKAGDFAMIEPSPRKDLRIGGQSLLIRPSAAGCQTASPAKADRPQGPPIAPGPLSSAPF
ncbi:DUF4153 domain-containing protein [Caulobacter sp. SL161]|uniref:DUF4153 domain-containing protein n=1 Tax=Caulobacter sp. SL161 TaxID=2995156 RepID=UPI0022767B9B|nr:DUF4153 domain-containing protein [Caulobacter sp. SL161]MCY1645721.1 DUF4153 domain-containing protein [Caulobacter sp. SL161]